MKPVDRNFSDIKDRLMISERKKALISQIRKEYKALALNKIRVNANIVKDVIIPSEVIKKLFLIVISLFIFLRIDKILIDKTGKTQGIAFKIIPPIKLIIKT